MGGWGGSLEDGGPNRVGGGGLEGGVPGGWRGPSGVGGVPVMGGGGGGCPRRLRGEGVPVGWGVPVEGHPRARCPPPRCEGAPLEATPPLFPRGGPTRGHARPPPDPHPFLRLSHRRRLPGVPLPSGRPSVLRPSGPARGGSGCPSGCPAVRLCVCLAIAGGGGCGGVSVRVSVCPSGCPLGRPSVHPGVCLSIGVSVCLSIVGGGSCASGGVHLSVPGASGFRRQTLGCLSVCWGVCLSF